MKKGKLKKGVRFLLIILLILSVIVIGAEQKNLNLFFTTKIIAGAIAIICGNILLEEEN